MVNEAIVYASTCSSLFLYKCRAVMERTVESEAQLSQDQCFVAAGVDLKFASGMLILSICFNLKTTAKFSHFPRL